MNMGDALRSQIHEAEEALLADLRNLRRIARSSAGADGDTTPGLTFGQRIAERWPPTEECQVAPPARVALLME